MMEQLLLHLLGDYVTQSHWMATEKTTRAYPALCHAVVYALPFALIASPAALIVIGVSHMMIDRFRLARYVVWAKNWLLSPGIRPERWEDCAATGYHKDVPPWLAVWLLIVCDNTMHLAINYACIKWM